MCCRYPCIMGNHDQLNDNGPTFTLVHEHQWFPLSFVSSVVGRKLCDNMEPARKKQSRGLSLFDLTFGLV